MSEARGLVDPGLGNGRFASELLPLLACLDSAAIATVRGMIQNGFNSVRAHRIGRLSALKGIACNTCHTRAAL